MVGIGELLWDVAPDGKRLGGAPANFAVMAGRLGNRAFILSRIGRDKLGRESIRHLNPMPVDTSCIQLDPALATGRVTVELPDGEPRYTIHAPAAWDFIESSDDWTRLAESADAVCFGSLAQRNSNARKTIQTLAARARANCVRVFDVNLRQPFYSAEVIERSIALATVVKMNDAEVPLVLELLGLNLKETLAGGTSPASPVYLRAAAERLLDRFPGITLVAVTRGSRGSLLVTRDAWDEHPGFAVRVADGIGAGDAFTAALTHYLLRGAGLATLNEAGNRWGSWIASQSGAMPALPDSVRDAITAAIERAEG